MKDNKEKHDIINKLIYYTKYLSAAPLSNEDVLKTIATCKDYLQRSHDIVQKSLPKVNSEVKEIVEVMRRMEKQAANESDPKIIETLSQTCSEFASGTSISSRNDDNEVANILLNANDNGLNALKKCHAQTLKMKMNVLLIDVINVVVPTR